MVSLEKRTLSTLSRVRKLDNWFRFLRLDRNYFALGRCRLCGDVTTAFGLCGSCFSDLPILARLIRPQHRSIHSVWGGFRYEFPISAFIADAKFRGNAGVAKLLARLLANQLSSQTLETDLLVPIPMPWPRLLRRGYNHAEVLASEIGKQLNIPVRTDVLVRRGWQPPQRGLTAQQRRQNLQSAFVVKCDVSDLRVTLIDDVLTTGATVASAASVLRRAGARQVGVWVIAEV